MRKVAIIGTGFIGQGWSIVFARAGCTVSLFDVAPGAAENALVNIRRMLDELEQGGFLGCAEEISQRIRCACDMQDALQDVEYVQECVNENREIKNGVFKALDARTEDDVILASSCSAIPPSTFLDDIPGRHRCLIAHPFNPPHVIPVVEIVRTPWTDPAIVTQTVRFMEQTGQVAVTVNQEIPGFIFNRLQAAVVNEAMHLVREGVASPEDIDRCMKDGLGLRWVFLGPFETMDLNSPAGFTEYAQKFGDGYREVGKDLNVSAAWTKQAVDYVNAYVRANCAQSDIRAKRAWRDRQILSLTKSGLKKQDVAKR